MRNPLKRLQKKINFRLASNAAQHKPCAPEKDGCSPDSSNKLQDSTCSFSGHQQEHEDPSGIPSSSKARICNNRSSKLRLALAESKKANNNNNQSPASTKKKKKGVRINFGSRKTQSIGSLPTQQEEQQQQQQQQQQEEADETAEAPSQSPAKKPAPLTPPENVAPIVEPEHSTLSPSSHAHLPSTPKRSSPTTSSPSLSPSSNTHIPSPSRRSTFDAPTACSKLKTRDKVETSSYHRTPDASSDREHSSFTTTAGRGGEAATRPITGMSKKRSAKPGKPERPVIFINPNLERIAKAAAALDNTGNELFERGEYDKAMANYVKALKLKNRTLMSVKQGEDDAESEKRGGGGGAVPPIQERAPQSQDTEAKPLKNSSKEPDPMAKPSPSGADDIWISVATSINNIGYLRQQSGQASAEETMQAYQNSLQIKRRVLGNDNLSVGKTLNNLGTVHYLKREYEQALQAYREALQIMMASLGPLHLDVGTVHSNMGDVYWAQTGNATKTCAAPDSPQRNYQASRDSALRHYRRSLEIRWEELRDHRDPKIIRLLEKIAALEMGETFLALVQNNYRHRQSPKAAAAGRDDSTTPDGGTSTSPAKEAEETIVDDDEVMEAETSQPHVHEELRTLHEETKQDVKKIDLLQRKMAIDMVKDKLRLIREMKKLSSLNFYGSDEEEGSIGGDSAELTPISATSPLSPVERAEALSAVKERLHQLRDSRTEELAPPNFRCIPVSDLKEADRSPSNYFLSHRASQLLNRLQHQHHPSSDKSCVDGVRKFSFSGTENEPDGKEGDDAPWSNIAVPRQACNTLGEGIDVLRNLSLNHENLHNSGNQTNPWLVPPVMTTSPENPPLSPTTPLQSASMAAF